MLCRRRQAAGSLDVLLKHVNLNSLVLGLGNSKSGSGSSDAYLAEHCVQPKRIVQEYAVALNGQPRWADVVVVGRPGRTGAPGRVGLPAILIKQPITCAGRALPPNRATGAQCSGALSSALTNLVICLKGIIAVVTGNMPS